MISLKDNFKKIFKHQSLLRFFVVATIFSFLFFFVFTGFTVGFSQYKNFHRLTRKYEVNQLKILELNIDQYLSNRVKVISDLASFPLILDSVMNMKEDDPVLTDFISLFKIFGNEGKKALFDIDHNLIFLDSELYIKDFNQNYVDEILNGRKKFIVALKDATHMSFYLPVFYNNKVEGVLYYCEKFSLMDIFGDLNSVGVSLKTLNGIEIKKNFSEDISNYIESEYDKYGVKLAIASSGELEREVIFTSLLNLFLSLLVGSLISAFFVFIYGKKYLLEPFEQLEKTESRLELALEASGVGTWYWDVRTGYVTWDDYIYKVYGAEKTDFENNYDSFESFVLKEDRSKLKEEIQFAIENNTSLDSEFRINRADNNEVRHIGVKAKAFFDEAGELISMTGVNFDVTSIKELSHKLKQSQEELSMILDALPAFIFYKDSNNTILRANKLAADSLDVSKEDLVNAKTEDYFPELAAKYLKDDLEVINSGTAKLGIEEEYVPENGERRWIRTDKVPLTSHDSDKADSILVMAVDVTEQKYAQNLIAKKTLELEKSNKSLEEFAYFVSHDLQEPIRTVSNYVELLIRTITKERELDEKSEQFSEYILDATKRMRNMIKDILTYARVGNMGSIVDVNIQDVLNEVQMSLETKIEETGASFVLGDLPTIRARKYEMIQLFQNLITNSIKFTPPGRKPIIQIDCVEEDQEYKFKFRDNGIGLKEEDFEKIFVIFQTVHNEYEQGTGVGLSICKKVINSYQGEISLSSEYGKWTEFSFSLKDLVTVNS